MDIFRYIGLCQDIGIFPCMFIRQKFKNSNSLTVGKYKNDKQRKQNKQKSKCTKEKFQKFSDATE